jgi:uncharacterized protein (TIGR02453 family)
MAFDGFPDELLTFYEGLEADNSKAYWTDNRTRYDRAVAEPMRALLDELGPRFGEAKFFRPYRDVRFSKDKTPYKTHAAAAVGDIGGAGVLYLQVGADGLLVGGGVHGAASDQVERYRAAVAHDRTGAALDKIVKKLRSGGYEIYGEQLRSTPRGYPADHPRADLLRNKSLHAGTHHVPADWLHTRKCLEVVVRDWKALGALNAWLADNVGPSRQPADRRR